jgi:hypothetical protein
LAEGRAESGLAKDSAVGVDDCTVKAGTAGRPVRREGRSAEVAATVGFAFEPSFVVTCPGAAVVVLVKADLISGLARAEVPGVAESLALLDPDPSLGVRPPRVRVRGVPRVLGAGVDVVVLVAARLQFTSSVTGALRVADVAMYDLT